MSSTKRKIDDQAYRFEVIGQDLTFDLRPDHNLIHLMSIICDQWLDNARDGDGGVFDHMWIVKTSSGQEFTAPYNDRGEDHEGETKLNELEISPSDMLSITYDMGSTTYFTVKFVSIENVTSDAELPRRVVQKSSTLPDTYTPPEGSPNLNEVFPRANELLFGQNSVAKWIAPFQCSKTCGGFVEAGPNAMGDVVFCPHKFGCFKEVLVAFDLCGQHNPDSSVRADAFSRMTFPRVMPNAQEEEKYKLFKEDYDKFEKYCKDNGLSALVPLSAIPWRMMGPKEVVIRVSEENMKAVEDVDIDKAFPKCAKAYLDKRHFWISYRHGKMMVCKGSSGSSDDRGIPKPGSVVASTNLDIHSLHEFFCVAEALFDKAGV